MNQKILVTGATGRIGRIVVDRLVNLHGVKPRVLVRDEAKARQRFGLPDDSVSYVEVDMSDAAGLDEALQNVSSCMLLSPVDPLQCQLQGNVVEAAQRQTGVYIVKVSGLCTALDSTVDSGRWHAETELKITRSGLSFTFLRPLFFMQNLGFQVKDAREKGVIRSAVTQQPINMIDVEDVGEIIADLLISRNKLLGAAISLTGPAALDYDEIAEVFTEVLGRKVEFESQSYAEVEKVLRQARQPDWHVKLLMQFNRALNEGWGNETVAAVSQVLGRQPRSFTEYLTKAASGIRENQGPDPFPS